jgi:hypothetical protein
MIAVSKEIRGQHARIAQAATSAMRRRFQKRRSFRGGCPGRAGAGSTFLRDHDVVNDIGRGVILLEETFDSVERPSSG